MGRTIGINLGATNSVVSVMEDSETKVIASEEGAHHAITFDMSRAFRGGDYLSGSGAIPAGKKSDSECSCAESAGCSETGYRDGKEGKRRGWERRRSSPRSALNTNSYLRLVRRIHG